MSLTAQRGMTLIEIMIGIALIAILSTLAVPAFQHWIQNAQIRNGAEGILNGLQVARAEAVRRNMNVEFAMSGTSGWTVTTVTTATVVQTREATEGSSNSSVAVLPAGATKITFNGLGWLTTNADASPSISQVDVTSATSPGPETRALRVFVTSGGAAKMCDPYVAAGDPRACP